jgi:predicted GNAT superfamily acetyltransferase
VSDPVVARAVRAATGAAQAAGVEVRDLPTLADQAPAVALLSRIWGRTAENPQVPPGLLLALARAGHHVSGAFDGDTLVGATMGFGALAPLDFVYSHIAGVAPEMAGRSVGFAMKLHQRAWALERGIDAIQWTYDPLLARNAHFNLAKLGAHPVEYLPDYYGVMADAINGVDETDRLLVRWDLRADEVERAAAGVPVVVDPTAPGRMAVAVPADIDALRAAHPDEARMWRRTVREQLMPVLAAGDRVVGFDRLAGYVIERHSR